MLVNRLTIDGRAFFLPDPVDQLKESVLAAVRDGATWITVPAWGDRAAVEVFVARGVPVAWDRVELHESRPAAWDDGDAFALSSLDY
jgi:hypothetical protein